MSAVLLAALAATGFWAASSLAFIGGKARGGGGAYPAAVAAGILLALAFADLFPEGLELAGNFGVVGFVGGFAVLFLVESFALSNAHHLPENFPKGALGTLLLGLAIHNLTDGFVLGVGAEESAATSTLLGLGVIIHQVPVGVSLAAVFLSVGATRARAMWTMALLAFAIPLAAALTEVAPVPGGETLGFLTGVAGGALAYVGAAHLLPETRTMHAGRVSVILLAATLLTTTFIVIVMRG